jgi:hypothetical protein
VLSLILNIFVRCRVKSYSRWPISFEYFGPDLPALTLRIHHLRQWLVFLNVPVMQRPEAYIGGADKLFDAEGKLIVDSTREFLEKFVRSFAAWIEANRKC